MQKKAKAGKRMFNIRLCSKFKNWRAQFFKDGEKRYEEIQAMKQMIKNESKTPKNNDEK